MLEGEQPASFADMAISLSLALSKMRLDLAHTLIVARRIGLTNMGMEVVAVEREHDIRNIEAAFDLLKEMAGVEPQIRAVLARKATRRWSDFARAAVL